VSELNKEEWWMTSETDSGNLKKLLSGEPLTYTELLQLSIVPELETHVLDLILSDQVKIDEYSDDGPDFLRTLYIFCLQQINISKEQVMTFFIKKILMLFIIYLLQLSKKNKKIKVF
jgi:hypothetical protein